MKTVAIMIMGAGLIVVPVILGYRTGGDGQTTALKIPNEIKTLNAMRPQINGKAAILPAESSGSEKIRRETVACNRVAALCGGVERCLQPGNYILAKGNCVKEDSTVVWTIESWHLMSPGLWSANDDPAKPPDIK